MQRVYTMQSYHLLQRGSIFTEDIEVWLERASAKCRVKTNAHKDGRGAVLEETIEVSPDV